MSRQRVAARRPPPERRFYEANVLICILVGLGIKSYANCDNENDFLTELQIPVEKA